MPVVFVHGVNNRRESPGFEAGRLVTSKFLQRYLSRARVNGRELPASPLPAFPYWGDLGTRFAWDMASLPSGRIDQLGVPLDADLRPLVALVKDALGDRAGAVDEPLLALALRSFPLAVDVLSEALLTSPESLGQGDEDVADFVLRAQEYALAHEDRAPAWVAGVTTDEQLLALLLGELEVAGGVDSLGILGRVGAALAAAGARLKHAVGAAKERVLDTVGDFASTKALAWSRASLNGTLGRFFGDVFVYMHGRGDVAAPGPIPARILGEWDRAIAAAPGEPLVIIGHSLGGVISYDLLTHFRPGLQVDLFVSIGSQVSHFEEIKLFRVSDPAIPGGDPTRRVARPHNIARWINVFDEVDIFSYACENVFSDVHDFHFDTRTYVVKAHGAYFTQARFYERLRHRIDAIQ